MTDRIDPAEIRTEFERIRKRYTGSDLAAIRFDKVEKIEAYVSGLEEATAGCTCGANHRLFDLAAHLSVPSRANPMAAAFAVNARKGA
jgi:hypothetical protein